LISEDTAAGVAAAEFGVTLRGVVCCSSGAETGDTVATGELAIGAD